MKAKHYRIIIILLITNLILGIAVAQKGGGNDNGLINGIDYKDHDVNLINKHGWEFTNQDDMDTFLANYYTHVSNILNSQYSGQIGFVVNGANQVKSYRYSIDITNPNEHILAPYQHERPVIARKWREFE